MLDLTGRWCRERAPQRRDLELGTWLREMRRGRTGFDTPLMLVAGTPGFGWRSGEVWGIHLGWSGDSAYWAERLPDGHATLAAAELLEPGEVVLGEYTTPWLYAAYSDRGLDGLSAAFHGYLRARPTHPRVAAAGRAEHLGGGLLRPRPRPPHAAGRDGRRRPASSASCSTTAGSATAATTPPGSATGTSTPTSGPTA